MTIDTSKEAVERLALLHEGISFAEATGSRQCLVDVDDARFMHTIATERDAQTARADAAEVEVARLKDENERLREALSTKRDYVQDVANGKLVNVSPVSLVGMAKDDLDMINAALQRKAEE